MSDKNEKKVPEQEKNAPQELNLDDLDAVQGGSLANVYDSPKNAYDSPTKISGRTRLRIDASR